MIKKIVFILTLILSVGLIAEAQTSYNNIGFLGGRYESDQKVIVNVGYGINISGSIWGFSYLDIGLDKDLGAEVGVFTTLKFIDSESLIFSNIGIGLLAGPGFDWIANYNEDGNINFTDYIRGAGGAILYYDITSRFGLSSFAKYKFSFEGDNQYVDGWIVGANGYVRF